MPNPPGWYYPLGNGRYRVRTPEGKFMDMQIDPQKLDRKGYQRTSGSTGDVIDEREMVKQYFKKSELMAGPQRSRQWIETAWDKRQKLLNDPGRVRQGSTEAQRLPPSGSKAEPEDYRLTDKGIVPILPQGVDDRNPQIPPNTNQSGLLYLPEGPTPEEEEKVRQLELELQQQREKEIPEVDSPEYLDWLNKHRAVTM